MDVGRGSGNQGTGGKDVKRGDQKSAGSKAAVAKKFLGEILKDKGSENYKKVGSFSGDLKEFLPSGDDEGGGGGLDFDD